MYWTSIDRTIDLMKKGLRRGVKAGFVLTVDRTIDLMKKGLRLILFEVVGRYDVDRTIDLMKKGLRLIPSTVSASKL